MNQASKNGRAKGHGPSTKSQGRTRIAPPPFVLMTIPQVAAKLRVGKTKVYTLIDSGALPSLRLSSRRCTRVHSDDLKAYIESLRPARRCR